MYLPIKYFIFKEAVFFLAFWLYLMLNPNTLPIIQYTGTYGLLEERPSTLWCQQALFCASRTSCCRPTPSSVTSLLRSLRHVCWVVLSLILSLGAPAQGHLCDVSCWLSQCIPIFFFEFLLPWGAGSFLY